MRTKGRIYSYTHVRTSTVLLIFFENGWKRRLEDMRLVRHASFTSCLRAVAGSTCPEMAKLEWRLIFMPPCQKRSRNSFFNDQQMQNDWIIKRKRTICDIYISKVTQSSIGYPYGGHMHSIASFSLLPIPPVQFLQTMHLLFVLPRRLPRHHLPHIPCKYHTENLGLTIQHILQSA